jgi:hypothetical protein
MITDPTLLRIGHAAQLNHQGEREAARQEFWRLRDEIGGEQGDPLVRCPLADTMADERVAEAGVSLSAAGMYPSLHLHLAECYRMLGDLARAREHLHAARTTIGALGDDEYGQLVRRGLEQVAAQLR